MENKTLDFLSKALIGVGLGYLVHMVATMPKELQTELGTLAGLGETDTIKRIAGSINGQGQTDEQKPQEVATDKETERARFIPQTDANKEEC